MIHNVDVNSVFGNSERHFAKREKRMGGKLREREK